MKFYPSVLQAIVLILVALCSCGGGREEVRERVENREAKITLQGVWMDAETEEVAFYISGDTIVYADNTAQPTLFRIIDDTLFVGTDNTSYPIIRLTRNIFKFYNQNAEEVSLVHTDDPQKEKSFSGNDYAVQTVIEQVKSDTVVNYAGVRYHLYTAINPTTYKVVVPTYTAEGMRVDNVFYDNIINISVFQGRDRLFKQDFRKSQFDGIVPNPFLSQAILCAMDYTKTDARGFHFACRICIPNDAGCYLLDAVISFDGKVDLEVLEY